jgi:hypothetical protein
LVQKNIIVGKSNSSSIVSTGNQNTAIGNYQLRGATLGAANISVGPNVFDAATVGNHNIAIGNSSGSGITAGTGNIMFGQSVGDGQTIGSNNIAIGGLIDFHATGATASNQLNIQNIFLVQTIVALVQIFLQPVKLVLANQHQQNV